MISRNDFALDDEAFAELPPAEPTELADDHARIVWRKFLPRAPELEDRMTNADTLATPQPFEVKKKIRELGTAIRWAAVLWCAWGFGLLSWQWTHRVRFDEQISKLYQLDPSAITDARYMGAAVVGFASWAATVALVVTIWRLAQTFIDGRYFTLEASHRMRIVALTGFAAIAIDIVARPVGTAILSSDLFAKLPLFFWLRPQDLLYALICAFFLALASILAEASAPQATR
jgi:hypothetical protein